MSTPIQPISELIERGISLLVRDLGVANTARFLQQFGAGHGDYSKDRIALFGNMTLKELIERSSQFNQEE